MPQNGPASSRAKEDAVDARVRSFPTESVEGVCVGTIVDAHCAYIIGQRNGRSRDNSGNGSETVI